ncbi:hypothetical protein ACFVYC_01940 [Pseudarthrobacter sp. NPDC058329]|uniref:hypothetical protein n=1 Tax=Pseudarthrobacter sp. NPDC058329 TaxID=3346448 RepID=UPI0036D9E548
MRIGVNQQMTQPMAATVQRQKGQRGVSVAATMVALVTYWLLQVRPLTSSDGFSWRNFRNYFPYDQYSYLAIAVNVRDGNMAAVEPFTETGINHYPRLYYVFLGLLSRLLHSDLIATWQLTGLAFQLVMVAAISWLLIRLTGRPLMGMLGFLPSIIGTFAVAFTGNWYHALDNHAVLWGAFGVFFTLNGESAALSVAVTAICLLIGVTFPRGDCRTKMDRKAFVVVIIAAAAIGALANVQTYSFLTAVYLAIYGAGAFGVMKYGNLRHIIVSLGLLVAVILGGQTVASTLGPLVTLVAGLAAALPGFSLILIKHKKPVIAAGVTAAMAASPTIVGTLLGLADKDDFLTYREASSTALGVPFGIGLLAALVPLLMLALILYGGIAYRNKAWLAFAIGASTAWALVASNDIWGANQEPYRFWIDSFTIVTAAAVPILCQVGVKFWNVKREQLRLQGEMPRSRLLPSADAVRVSSRSQAVIVGAVCFALLGGLVVSFADYSKFSGYVNSQGTERFDDLRGTAIQAAVVPLTEDESPLRIQINHEGQASELLLGDPCINPFQLKTTTGLPTAFYNLGLAWPNDEPHLREILKQRLAGAFAHSHAKNAGIKYVITDSSCSAGWQNQVQGTRVSEVDYSADGKLATITLWDLAG